jgi:hypothetical protein
LVEACRNAVAYHFEFKRECASAIYDVRAALAAVEKELNP